MSALPESIDFDLGGVSVRAFGSHSSLVSDFLSGNRSLIALNALKVMTMRSDETLLEFMNANRVYVDGFGISLSLLRKFGVWRRPIPGSEVWLSILAALDERTPIAIVGSEEYVLARARKKLTESFPCIRIVYTHHGFFSEKEMPSVLFDLANSGAQIVFVAMGSPKQEKFIEQLSLVSDAKSMGLGGSLDVYTGDKKRAPRAFRAVGLEWLHRLITQPNRLRQAPVLVRFFTEYIVMRSKH